MWFLILYNNTLKKHQIGWDLLFIMSIFLKVGENNV